MPTTLISTSRGNVVTTSSPDENGRQAYVRDSFAISADIIFTVANERRPVTINIPSDADFVAVKGMVQSRDAAPVVGGMMIQIIDSGADRRLTDAQVPVSCLFGTGQLPFIWPWVHRFARNGNCILDVTNTGSATQRIHIVIAGYKMIPVSRL